MVFNNRKFKLIKINGSFSGKKKFDKSENVHSSMSASSNITHGALMALIGSWKSWVGTVALIISQNPESDTRIFVRTPPPSSSVTLVLPP